MKCEICGTECASAITARHLNGPNCRDYEGRRLSTVDYAALFGGSIGRGGCVYPGDTAPTEKRRGLRRSRVPGPASRARLFRKARTPTHRCSMCSRT